MPGKPKHGLDVNMEATEMENDPWANKMLKEIGTTISKKEVTDGMKYGGSVAIHFLVEGDKLNKPKYRISSITQIALDNETNENVAASVFVTGKQIGRAHV